MSVSRIPEGFHTITPYLVVDGADAAIELYQRALGAVVVEVSRMPDGKLMNAQLRIGNSMLMLNDEFPDYGALGPKKVGGTSVTLHLFTEDVDALWAQATAAGFQVEMPLENQFWGDRYGQLKDPFGHSWSLASRITNLTPEEMRAAEAEFTAKS